jgi:transposase
MFRLDADLKVYLHREPIDFRAGINSLAVLVQEVMELDPFAPAVFAFCNRRRDRMKLLFFDRSGFVLVLKRLTEDKFRWPRREVPLVGRDGRRRYDPASRDQLVAACSEPGVSASRLAREHDVNANLVRKWIKKANSGSTIFRNR